MKKLCLLSAPVLLLLACGSPPRPAGDPAAPAWAAVFPDSFTGEFAGPLTILDRTGQRREIGMTLDITPVEKGIWRFAIRYEGQPVRNYRLLAVDGDPGRFEIDEGNGIRIPTFLIGDELVSHFAVSGNRLTSRYRAVPEGILFEVIMGSAEPAGRTGGEGGVPPVDVYDVRVVQRGVLSRSQAAGSASSVDLPAAFRAR